MRILIFAAILMAGCATNSQQERAANAMAKYSPYCEKMGYQRDTDKWRACIQTQVSDQKAAVSRIVAQ